MNSIEEHKTIQNGKLGLFALRNYRFFLFGFRQKNTNRNLNFYVIFQIAKSLYFHILNICCCFNFSPLSLAKRNFLVFFSVFFFSCTIFSFFLSFELNLEQNRNFSVLFSNKFVCSPIYCISIYIQHTNQHKLNTIFFLLFS